jgi:hypothetical protein
MLASITPLGERGRSSRWPVTMSAFVVGGVAGGVAMGSLLGGLAAVASGGLGWTAQQRLGALGAVALAAVLLDASKLRLPTTRRQVDEQWLQRYRGWVYGSGFGVQLGLGVVTIVVTASVYAAFAAAFLTATPIGGAIVGGAFGLARAATALAVAPVRSPAQLATLGERLRRWDRPARGIALVLEAALATAVIAAAVATAPGSPA